MSYVPTSNQSQPLTLSHGAAPKYLLRRAGRRDYKATAALKCSLAV